MHTTFRHDGTAYHIDFEVTGAYERQTRHHPGASPDLEIVDISPDPPDDFPMDAARDECWQVAEEPPEPPEPEPDPPMRDPLPKGYDGR